MEENQNIQSTNVEDISSEEAYIEKMLSKIEAKKENDKRLAAIEKQKQVIDQETQKANNKVNAVRETIKDDSVFAMASNAFGLNEYDVAELYDDMMSEGFNHEQVTKYLDHKMATDPRSLHSSKHGNNRAKLHREVMKGLNEAKKSNEVSETTSEIKTESQFNKPMMNNNIQPDRITTSSNGMDTTFKSAKEDYNKANIYNKNRMLADKIFESVH